MYLSRLGWKFRTKGHAIRKVKNGYGVDGFTGMKAFDKMISSTRIDKAVRYYITNTMDEELIFDATESRWTIENNLYF